MDNTMPSSYNIGIEHSFVTMPTTPTNNDELFEAINTLLGSAKAAKENLTAREQAFETKLAKVEQLVENQLTDIQKTVHHFKQTLDELNSQNWQSIIDAIQNSSQQSTQGLQELYSNTQKTITDTCKHFEQASTAMVRNLGRTINSLQTNDIEQFAENCTEQVKTVVKSAQQRMQDTLQWFHWKNLAAATFISMIIVLGLGLYINGEWPWQAHQTIVKQRSAGQALINSWPQLSITDQLLIERNVA